MRKKEEGKKEDEGEEGRDRWKKKGVKSKERRKIGFLEGHDINGMVYLLKLSGSSMEELFPS